MTSWGRIFEKLMVQTMSLAPSLTYQVCTHQHRTRSVIYGIQSDAEAPCH